MPELFFTILGLAIVSTIIVILILHSEKREKKEGVK
jgi:hypothetical protein